MTVAPVSSISFHSQDASRQGGVQQDIKKLQRALSSGDLGKTREALEQFHKNVQAIPPAQNGVRVSSDVDPESTKRSNFQALQSALDAGNLAVTQQTSLRIQQDTAQASNGEKIKAQNRLAIRAFSGQSSEGSGQEAGGVSQNRAGSSREPLIDVSA